MILRLGRLQLLLQLGELCAGRFQLLPGLSQGRFGSLKLFLSLPQRCFRGF